MKGHCQITKYILLCIFDMSGWSRNHVYISTNQQLIFRKGGLFCGTDHNNAILFIPPVQVTRLNMLQVLPFAVNYLYWVFET